MDEKQTPNMVEKYLGFLELGMAHANEWMNSNNEKDREVGAYMVLNCYLKQYNRWDSETKNRINMNVNNLEKKAVKILVDQGHSKIIEESLLKRYGYSVGSGDYFGAKSVKGRQNPNTK